MNVTPQKIVKLKSNEIFVFGSNLEGKHTVGEQIKAINWGAIPGQGVGLHGQTYAIPALVGHIIKVQPYIDDFINFAKRKSALNFYVTRIGCGVEGFTDYEIAPMFIKVKTESIENIFLPLSFWEVLG
jgi:hypothetical protein